MSSPTEILRFTVLSAGGGVLGAVLTGGIGIWDIAWAPLASYATDGAARAVLTGHFFSSKREEYMALLDSQFERLLDELALDAIARALPRRASGLESLRGDVRRIRTAYARGGRRGEGAADD